MQEMCHIFYKSMPVISAKSKIIVFGGAKMVIFLSNKESLKFWKKELFLATLSELNDIVTK